MGLFEIGMVAAAVIVLLLVILFTCYVKAPPSTAYVISGIKREPRILIGAGGVKIPIFERLDKVYLGQLTVDIRTERSVPTNDFINVNVDAVAKVAVTPTPEGVRLAARNFLNMDASTISASPKAAPNRKRCTITTVKSMKTVRCASMYHNSATSTATKMIDHMQTTLRR